ncbi:hypothetical protein [Propionibacterium australiense]|uniref:Uncharacterized protein n=1 Tax=Propionibacterium australiense TaxID=119981 RepID=A0A383S971_9ACTN|nr:hypothetical protein [Propionibacterium australiense]RLP10960.1 hypothetical protein D9T14_04240 [Propionibacterium australiense]RLP13073.1 hypothetical protein D7U36_01215 [Propionibacterium australiense]SYZ33919.1 Hypothetical protein PROPAUS_1875 [Propionibacterium australiense]VEH90940.1 Uncharacterised protein [Propionibacterium australiense]
MAFSGRDRRAAFGTRRIFERLTNAQGTTVGAVVHDLGATNVLTFAVMPIDGTLVEVSSRIECRNANPFTWTHALTRIDDRLHDLERTPDMPSPCVPVWAEYGIAHYLADKPAHAPISCTMIDEITGERHEAAFAWTEPGIITWTLDGVLRRRYTVVSEQIVSSEQGGLTAVLVTGEDALLSGMDQEIRYRVIDFIKDANER